MDVSKLPIKVVKNGHSVTIVGQGRALQIKNMDEAKVLHLLTSDDLSPMELNLVSRIKRGLSNEEQIGEIGECRMQPYELGDRILLVSNVCNQCMALQHPFCSLPRHTIPEWLLERAYRHNMSLTLDECGIVSLSALTTVAHAKCCPTSVVPFTDFSEERTVNESLLQLDLLSQVIRDYQFYHEVVWTIEADLLHAKKRFFGITKSETIEKLIVYVLENYYNYEGFFLGFSKKTALLQYLNASSLNAEQGPLQQTLDIIHHPLIDGLGMKQRIQCATYEHMSTPTPFLHVRLTLNDTHYHSIASSLEHALIDIYSQYAEGDTYVPQPGVALHKLYQYHDGFTEKYHFCIIGGE